MTEDILERAKALRDDMDFVSDDCIKEHISELIAEVERLRSENLDYSCIARDLDFDITKKARLIDAQHDGILRLRKRLAAKDARIKELSDLNEALMENGNDLRERCQKAEGRCQELLDTLKIVSENYDALFNEHERLEAAFLEAKAQAIHFHEMVIDTANDPFQKSPSEQASDALERIRSGKDE